MRNIFPGGDEEAYSDWGAWAVTGPTDQCHSQEMNTALLAPAALYMRPGWLHTSPLTYTCLVTTAEDAVGTWQCSAISSWLWALHKRQWLHPKGGCAQPGCTRSSPHYLLPLSRTTFPASARALQLWEKVPEQQQRCWDQPCHPLRCSHTPWGTIRTLITQRDREKIKFIPQNKNVSPKLGTVLHVH